MKTPLSKQHYPVSTLSWSQTEMQAGKVVHVKDFPKDYYLHLFCLPLSTERTDYVVTNANRLTDKGLAATTQPTAEKAQQACKVRWKAYLMRYAQEQVHRELKQCTGIEKCQCRKERIQRNHITCAILVWVRLNALAQKMKTTIYQLKQSLLDQYMMQQLRNPTVKMAFA